MSFIDNEAELTSATAFDLESVRPGPGQPLLMYASGMTPGAQIAVTSSDASGGTYLGTTDATVGADGTVEFRLPSSCLQFVKSTFAAGRLGFVMEGNQTNL